LVLDRRNILPLVARVRERLNGLQCLCTGWFLLGHCGSAWWLVISG